VDLAIMGQSDRLPLLVVDIGNSRMKLGEFHAGSGRELPVPVRSAALPADWTSEHVERALARGPDEYEWIVASVNRPAAARLSDWLAEKRVRHVRHLSDRDIPMRIEVPRPERVGIDRLANAFAANRLRANNQPAIAIDMGSAITLGLVSRDGAFVGGAILPGIGLSARALHEFTDLLPLVPVNDPPPVLGTETEAAMQSGLYWGAVGAIREIVARLVEHSGPAAVYLTGGSAPSVASILERESETTIEFVPHLTLAGIALASLASTKE
jgi:type III pantothenate kinase